MPASRTPPLADWPAWLVVQPFAHDALRRAPEAVTHAVDQTAVMQPQRRARRRARRRTRCTRTPSGPGAPPIRAAGRAQAITAEAQTRATQRLARSITPTLVPYAMPKTWNGHMPQGAGGAIPMIQMPGQMPGPKP